jgi:hypothetical protein
MTTVDDTTPAYSEGGLGERLSDMVCVSRSPLGLA